MRSIFGERQAVGRQNHFGRRNCAARLDRSRRGRCTVVGQTVVESPRYGAETCFLRKLSSAGVIEPSSRCSINIARLFIGGVVVKLLLTKGGLDGCTCGWCAKQPHGGINSKTRLKSV